MNHPVDLFVRIIKTVSEGALQPEATTTIGEFFEDPEVFSPLQFELCLYSLETTLYKVINDRFFEETHDLDMDMTLSEFLDRYFDEPVPDDPLFITRQFMKFARSARRKSEEMAEPGGN